MNAIATTYRGTQFRSRLEAKWAAFFDACGWSWNYEPLDLPGWIPDFSLGWRPTLLEIKPFFHEEPFANALEKITRAGHTDPVVLLGAAPRVLADGDLALGWLAERWTTERPGEPTHTEWVLSNLHFGYTEGNGRLGLCPMESGWANIIWAAPAGDPYANKWSRVHSASLEDGTVAAAALWDSWALAHNHTQWRPRCA